MKSYLRILSYCKPYKFMVFISILSSFLFALFNALSIWLVGSLITSIMMPNKSTLDDSSMFLSFENFINPEGDPIQALKILCFMLVLIFFLKNIFFYINNISLSYVQTKMIVDIRNKLFNHISSLPLSFFHKNKTGELTSITINDVTNMRTTFTQSIQNLINQPLSLIVMLVMLFIINTKLSLLMLIAAPVSFTIIIILVNSIKRKATRSSIQIAGLTTILQEMLSGIRIVKSFISEKKESLKFKKSNNRFFKLIMQQERLRFLNAPINEMIGVILGATLLWIGGLAVLQTEPGSQSLEAEKFVRFIIFLFAMLQPARKLTGVASIMQQGIASAERVFSILDVKLDNEKSNNLTEIKKFNSSIEFQDVSFTYESSNKPAIDNISFNIKKGDYVALIGESGAGKSTTIDLLMRFYNPQKGTIKIDGANLKTISKNSLRAHIGIVPQEIILFNDTVKNNISYGFDKPNIADVKKAATAANAIDFINDLPNGFDTIIGERGSKLSGGQKQRLSIARAIFKNPKILILDEATSSLDSESEQKVKNAIDNLVKDRTVIVIAHRLSTIINSDKILVFENGTIIDSGKHSELIERSSLYKKLYNLQFKTKNE
tara:strand:+ start:263 stop:2077 length:1815 start_codon:yes stop_codon:yes gene_type:complete